jgi:hypothetical protein
LTRESAKQSLLSWVISLSFFLTSPSISWRFEILFNILVIFTARPKKWCSNK